MKKTLLILLFAIFSISVFGQTFGPGWYPVRVKQNFTDSINFAKQFKISGVNVTSSAAELNVVDGALINVNELNRLQGVNANVQTQLDLKANTVDPSFTGTFDVEALRVGGIDKLRIDSISSEGATAAIMSNGDTLGLMPPAAMLVSAYEYLTRKHPDTLRVTSDYTLVAADDGRTIIAEKGTWMKITIPPESSVAFPNSTIINIIRNGAGNVSIKEGSGVVTYSPKDSATINTQYGWVTLYKRDNNKWWLIGTLED